MNLEPTEEQRELRATVRRFLAERASVATHVRPLLDDATGTTPEVWRGLADLGATGLLLPADYGGAGASMVEAGLVAEELGAALHPGPWLSTAVAVPRALSHFAAEAAAADLLASIADGSTIAALCSATDVQVGDDGVTGTVTAVPDAAAADVLLVLVGEGLHLVDRDTDRVSVEPMRGIDPTRKAFRVTFDGAPARLLGTAGPRAIRALADDVLIASAADALGAAETVVGLAVEYAKSRAQFGQPIGSFQSVAHLCVDMYETVELARGGVLHALWAADNPDVHPDAGADSDERHLAAVRLKAFAGRLASVGDTAIQVFGGIGFTWEHDAHLYLKRLLAWSALSGGPDPYLEELGMLFAASRTLESTRSST